jgi:hypothetical protein
VRLCGREQDARSRDRAELVCRFAGQSIEIAAQTGVGLNESEAPKQLGVRDPASAIALE